MSVGSGGRCGVIGGLGIAMKLGLGLQTMQRVKICSVSDMQRLVLAGGKLMGSVWWGLQRRSALTHYDGAEVRGTQDASLWSCRGQALAASGSARFQQVPCWNRRQVAL